MCCVLGQVTLFTECLSTLEYKCVTADCQGSLMKCCGGGGGYLDME